MEPQFTKTPALDHLDDLLKLVRRLADNSEQLAHGVRRTATAIENIAKEGKVIYQAVAPLYERFESLRAGRPIMVRSEVSRTEVRAHPRGIRPWRGGRAGGFVATTSTT